MPRICHRLIVTLLLTGACACGKATEESQGDKAPGAAPAPAAEDSSKEPPPPDAAPDAAASEKKPTPPDTAQPPAAAIPCAAPAGTNTNPQTIQDAVDLINALPKPLSIACFVSVLQRPLHLNATSSRTSVQPAVSEAVPRVFLFFGSSLIITFVPSGEGSKAVEFSYMTSSTMSVKAEIAFPVTAAVAADAGYTSILKATKNGTSCSACHGLEQAAPAPFGAGVYTSRALRPVASKDVTLFEFKYVGDQCVTNTSEACRIIRAIFEHGDVLPRAFSTDLPTLF